MDQEKINPAIVQKSLRGVDFPATKDSLVEYANSNGAEREVVDFLERIPEQEYASPAQVTQQIGDQSVMDMVTDDTI